MDTTEDDKVANSKDTPTITAGITALILALPIHPTHHSPITHLPTLLTTIAPILASPAATIATRTALYIQTTTLFTALSKRLHPASTNDYALAYNMLKLLELPNGAGAEAIRLKRAEAAAAIVKAVVIGAFGAWTAGREEWKAKMADEIKAALRDERAVGVKTVLERALKALEA
jgi:hypothetical protein